MKRSRSFQGCWAVLALALFANGCTAARPTRYSGHSGISRAAAFSPHAYRLQWAMQSALSAEDAKLELGSDQTVGIGGMLGETVNEVVPIPGTDMVRVGALQEGSFFQSNFRSPQQETTGQSGSVLTNATVVFRVFRPVR